MARACSLILLAARWAAASSPSGTISVAEAAARTLEDARALLAASEPPGSFWASQLGQDRWAALYALPALDEGSDEGSEGGGEEGRGEVSAAASEGSAGERWFVEVGAADGLELSNTHSLEQLASFTHGFSGGDSASSREPTSGRGGGPGSTRRRVAWRGVCVEASASSVAALRVNRPNCITVSRSLEWLRIELTS